MADAHGYASLPQEESPASSAPPSQSYNSATSITGYNYGGYAAPAGYGTVPPPSFQPYPPQQEVAYHQVQYAQQPYQQAAYPPQVAIGQPVYTSSNYQQHHIPPPPPEEDVCGVSQKDQACCAWTLCATGFILFLPWLFALVCIRSRVSSAKIAGILSMIFIIVAIVLTPIIVVNVLFIHQALNPPTLSPM